MTFDRHDFSGASVMLRWESSDGFHREIRWPGDNLDDLPDEVREEIEAHWTPELVSEYEAAQAAAREPEPPTSETIDNERDRRIAAGFEFNGVRYQTRSEDRENIAGASTAALAAMMNGAQPGDFRWHGGDSDFCWIAEDNSLVTMDAQTVFAFGQAAMAHKQAMIFAARALKDMETIPPDFADDIYWSN